MPRATASFLLLSLAALNTLIASASAPQLPPANTVVEPRAHVSLDPVPRGQTFDLAVVAKIRPGFHINAHEALQDYLIPTSLETQLPPGFRALHTLYPRGVLRKFKFSQDKLLVYEGSVTLRIRLQTLPDAQLGPQKIPLTLRYQACNDEACLPPVKLLVTAELQIAQAGAPGRVIHPEIFRTPRAKVHPRR